ncbi:aminoacyl-tRNA hydrolase [Lentisphaerota bacterium ZTH]|nr:aminoacyl-tRNA hydrolase [Lentisphaerota bacterium]WET06562.1 aminoacyl-tRNA hydrolase [Lentisphaerota bacterium ZTH]
MNNHMQHRISLIVGLGNPGAEYHGTRHNVGFDVIDAMLEKLPNTFTRKEGCSSIFWEGRFKGRKLLLQKPMTFMNLSGRAVAPLAARNEILPQEIMLVYDDMDLPLGRIRIRKNGSSAGHNGVQSVIDCLNTANFPRLRVGIGRMERQQHIDHVLSGFSAEEAETLETVKTMSVDALILSLSRGVTTAMNEYNGKAVSDGKENNTGEDAGSHN